MPIKKSLKRGMDGTKKLTGIKEDSLNSGCSICPNMAASAAIEPIEAASTLFNNGLVSCTTIGTPISTISTVSTAAKNSSSSRKLSFP